jgi:hypothetical protein
MEEKDKAISKFISIIEEQEDYIQQLKDQIKQLDSIKFG